MSKISSRIFIGDSSTARNRRFFLDNDIHAVLNCTSDINNYYPALAEYMRIPIEDSLLKKDLDLFFKYIPVIAAFIHKHVDIQKQNIYIHCWEGKQRSTAAVVAYLCMYKGKTLREARAAISSKRKEAFSYNKHVNFSPPLEKFFAQKI